MANPGDFRFPDHSGLLLVGHGSREAEGVAGFEELARLVARRAGPLPLEACFLEFAEPSIAEGFRRLAARGARRVVVVPVLLFAAGHAKRDIPSAVAAVAAEWPEIEVCQSAHLGCHPRIVELSRLRADEALGGRAVIAAAASELVVVGRGSRDPSATAEMTQFVELRRQASAHQRVSMGFVAMAEPPLEHVLEQAAARGPRRIVVQPHFLFGGVLVSRIRDTVARFAERFSRIEWVSTDPLGPQPLVAAAIFERAAAASSDVAAGRRTSGVGNP